MAYSKNAPFRADVVGSYLRPAELKQARADFAAGTIDAAGLKAVEDRLITELVAKQKAAGLHVITDGEFRRGWWHFDFMWGFNGVDHVAAAHRVAFHDEVTPADTATVTGKLDGHDHPFVEHFKFVKIDITDAPAVDKLFAEEHFNKVVNFAAESHVDRSIEDPGLFLRTNILGTQVLMDAHRRPVCRRLP